MNIIKEDIDSLNAVLKVEIAKDDYSEKVEESLKAYRKQAKLDGFRPGKVPMGLMRKMYGTHMMIDQINNLISDNLQKFISENKLHILGEPIPNVDKQQEIDWKTQENFEFFYDIALAPEVDIKLTKKNKLPFHKIVVDDKMIDQQIDQMKSSLGSQVSVQEIDGTEVVKVDVAECNEDGTLVENGHTKENASILVSTIKDEDKKKEYFIGKKIGESIIVKPLDIFRNETEVAAMLSLESSNSEGLSKMYKFEIREINRFVPAELNQDFFDKAFGEGVISSEEEMRTKIKEDGEKRFIQNSDYKLLLDFKDKMINDLNLELPEAFLKRWLIEANKDKKEITPEQIDSDFPLFMEDLKWQIIKGDLIKKNELTISEEELKTAAKEYARAQLMQFGFYHATEEDIERWGTEILQNREQGQKVYETELDKRLTALIKDSVKLEEKEVSLDEFNKMFEK